MIVGRRFCTALIGLAAGILGLGISAAHACDYEEVCENPGGTQNEATDGFQLGSFRGIGANRLRYNNGLPSSLRDDTVFLSSQGQDSTGLGVNALAGVTARRLSGTYSGHTADLLFGADTFVGDRSVIGILGDFTQGSIDIPAGLTVESRAFLAGPYFATQLSETLTIDGFILYGKPRYEVNGAEFKGEKLMGGLTLSGSIPTEIAEFVPFAGISAAREELPSFTDASFVFYPATTARTRIATIGTTAYFAPTERPNAIIQPFASLEVDFARFDDGFGTDNDFRTARIGAGMDVVMNSGVLELGLQASSSTDSTRVVGAKIFYSFGF